MFAPRSHGTQVLLSVFPEGSTDLVALFASTPAIAAPPGQADHAAVGQFLDASAGARSGGRMRIVAVKRGSRAAPAWLAEGGAPPAGEADLYAVTGHFGAGLGGEGMREMVRGWLAESAAAAAMHAGGWCWRAVTARGTRHTTRSRWRWPCPRRRWRCG